MPDVVVVLLLFGNNKRRDDTFKIKKKITPTLK